MDRVWGRTLIFDVSQIQEKEKEQKKPEASRDLSVPYRLWKALKPELQQQITQARKSL